MIRTESFLIAGALMARGFEQAGHEARKKPLRTTFVIDDGGREEEAAEIVHCCQREEGVGLLVDLGLYEEARNGLRDIVQQERETRNVQRRRT